MFGWLVFLFSGFFVGFLFVCGVLEVGLAWLVGFSRVFFLLPKEEKHLSWFSFHAFFSLQSDQCETENVPKVTDPNPGSSKKANTFHFLP